MEPGEPREGEARRLIGQLTPAQRHPYNQRRTRHLQQPLIGQRTAAQRHLANQMPRTINSRR
jgi:hypothetical protein